jgi:hypothetical protein
MCLLYDSSATIVPCLIGFLCDGYQKKEEGDIPFGMEDLLYYIKRVEEQKFDLDFGALKQFFPFNLVLSGVFKIFQDLFGNYILLLWMRFGVPLEYSHHECFMMSS